MVWMGKHMVPCSHCHVSCWCSGQRGYQQAAEILQSWPQFMCKPAFLPVLHSPRPWLSCLKRLMGASCSRFENCATLVLQKCVFCLVTGLLPGPSPSTSESGWLCCLMCSSLFAGSAVNVFFPAAQEKAWVLGEENFLTKHPHFHQDLSLKFCLTLFPGVGVQIFLLTAHVYLLASLYFAVAYPVSASRCH